MGFIQLTIEANPDIPDTHYDTLCAALIGATNAVITGIFELQKKKAYSAHKLNIEISSQPNLHIYLEHPDINEELFLSFLKLASPIISDVADSDINKVNLEFSYY